MSMTQTSRRILEIVERLTEDEQRRLVWQAIQLLEPEDAEPGDFEAYQQGQAEYVSGETIDDSAIDWD
jgi:hypothetical protein